MGVADNTPEHSGSGSDPEPERLLAEALRAQAGAPAEQGQDADAGAESVAGPAEQADTPADAGPPPGFGLLSGAADGSLERERAALDGAGSSSGRQRVPAGSRPGRSRSRLPARWILLLAVLLGLATGSMIGLLTLL